ncbi:MAG: MMPL family transporter [Gammaproteobacteria bacterium]|nr:MMPL family transporter [Gammaproteobacteria bacterium]
MSASRIENTVIKLAVFRPWFAILLCLSIFGLGTHGLSKLEFANDIRVFFSDKNPDKLTLDAFERQFAPNKKAVVAVRVKRGHIFEPHNMAAIATIVDRAWQLPYIRKVEAITNFPDSDADGDFISVHDFVPNPYDSDAQTLLELKARAQDRIEIRDSIINDRADMTLISIVYVDEALFPQMTLEEISQSLYALVDQADAEFANLEFYVSGSVALNAAFVDASVGDMSTLVPLALVALFTVLYLALANLSAVLLIGLAMLGSAMAGLSWLALNGLALNVGTAMTPLVILCICAASAIHFLTTVLRHRVQTSQTGLLRRRMWVIAALRENFWAISFSIATTALGFAAMNFSVSPPYQQLGSAVAIGLIFSWLLVIFVLPALISLGALRGRLRKTPLQRLCELLSPNLFKHGPAAAVVLALLSAASLAGLAKLVVADDFLTYFDQSHRFRRDSDVIEQNLTGMRIVSFALNTDADGGVYDPAFLREADAFLSWLRQQPEVTSVKSVIDTLKRLNLNMHGDDPAFDRLPDSSEQAAQFMFLYEMSLTNGDDLSEQITLDQSAMQFTVLLRDLDTAQVREFSASTEAWLAKNTLHISTAPTGVLSVFANITLRDSLAMMGGTLLALVLISICMMVALGDMKIGLISLIPNLVPALVGFAIWGLTVGDLTLASSVVVCITFGIVVDDTIHFLMGYQRLRKAGLSANAAAQSNLRTVGAGLIATTLALVAGFVVMSASSFAVNADLGAMTAITLVVALLADLILLPTILRCFDRGSAQCELQPDSVESVLTGNVTTDGMSIRESI